MTSSPAIAKPVHPSNRKLIKNFSWNVLGTIVPQLSALFAIPLLIDGLGAPRFGVLTIAWMIVGYFSLFDLGLGRALTKLVAEKLGARRESEIPLLVWSAMTLMLALGAFGSVTIISISPWLTASVLNIPDELKPETLPALYLLGLSVPIVITTIGLRGILEAHHRFNIVNIIRLPLGLATFLAPLLVLPFSSSLAHVVLILVLARCVGWFAYLFSVLRCFPDLRRWVRVDRESVTRLLSFGGWMTVSNITAPLLLYLGRFLIIVMISAEAVAYFVTPYEVVINMLVIPSMMISVLFPVFTQLFQGDKLEARRLYSRARLTIFILMFPLTIVVYFLAEPGLTWWINEEFAVNGYRVAQILVIGVLINSFGHLGQALIQSYGRPDLTAKLHLFELIVYIPYLWFLIDRFGIIGAALAWTVRVSISTLALTLIARRCLAGSLAAKY